MGTSKNQFSNFDHFTKNGKVICFCFRYFEGFYILLIINCLRLFEFSFGHNYPMVICIFN